jgi:signal transduction histidine kinase
MLAYSRFSLARQFLMASMLILLGGMVVIGIWVGRQIELGVINRTAAVTSLFVDSFISPQVQELADGDQLPAKRISALDRLLLETSLGKEIVAFKVWSPEGVILYSPNQSLIGQSFEFGDQLVQAFGGEVVSEISGLGEPENRDESRLWDELIETYLPIRKKGTDDVIAVAEFYQTPETLQAEVQAAQLSSWLIVGVATTAMYLLLAGIVGRASNTILSQQDQLRDQVNQLRKLLNQNEELHDRVRRAAARTTALNERFLRRISADLHDGPGQDLSLALLRIEALAETCENCSVPNRSGQTVAHEYRTVKAALDSALTELRTISAGLRLPEIGPLSPEEVTAHAVRDYERKTGKSVEVSIDQAPKQAAMPAKITLYRVIQEALANGYRHAAGAKQSVRLRGGDDFIHLEVADSGKGFDPLSTPTDGHLGLAGMKERVQLLGGEFTVESGDGKGVRVHASIQLDSTGSSE